jgi:hypothetical protein
MAGGSKLKDDKQEYQYSFPYVTPSGHEFSFYDTPGDERLLVRHSSGSHIEFKADGSVQIRAMTDIHQIQGIVSSASTGSEEGSDVSLQRVDTDHTIEVGGKLNIRCSELNFEVGSAGRIICGTDLEMKANNILERANEAVDIESSKSIHLDTKEVKTSAVTQRTSLGVEESTTPWGGGGGAGTYAAEGKSAGHNVQHVKGHHVIKNDDPTGGITIVSAGYLNLICGQERLDLVGRYLTTGFTAEQRATWTQSVYIPTPPSPLNISKPGGDYWFHSDSSGMYQYAVKMLSPLGAGAGFRESVILGNHQSTVLLGNKLETVAAGNKVSKIGLNKTVTTGANQTYTAGGVFKVTAPMILLN